MQPARSSPDGKPAPWQEHLLGEARRGKGEELVEVRSRN
jgi:hypothetical protein